MKMSLVLGAAVVCLVASSAAADFSAAEWAFSFQNSYPDGANAPTSVDISNGVVSLSASSQYIWDGAKWTGQDGTFAGGVYSYAGATAVVTATPDAAILHFRANVQYTGGEAVTPPPGTLSADWHFPIAFVSVVNVESMVQVDTPVFGSGWNDYYVNVGAGMFMVSPEAYSQLSPDERNQLGEYDPATLRTLTTNANFTDFSFEANAPEPATMALLCVGVAGLLRRRTR